MAWKPWVSQDGTGPVWPTQGPLLQGPGSLSLQQLCTQWRAVGEGLRPAPGCGAGWGSQLLPGLGEVRGVAETLRDKPPQGPQGPART